MSATYLDAARERTASVGEKRTRDDEGLFYKPSMQQTMLRVKDPRVSVKFYEDNFGMKLIHWMAFPQWKFTVYFLERQREVQSSPE